jgi:hypothetical protein
MKPASNEQSSDFVVLVVDDEAGVRHGIQDLLHSVGLQSTGYGSATELFGSNLADQATQPKHPRGGWQINGPKNGHQTMTTLLGKF